MFFQTKKGRGKEGRGKVAFFKLGFVFLLWTLALGLFPTETEGLECYQCYSFGNSRACVIPQRHLRTMNCKEGEYCKKVYTKGKMEDFFIRRCAYGSEHLNNSILFQCAEKFFGKEGEGGCLDITPENLKIVEDCHWSKVGRDLKYPGFGYSLRVLGSWEYGGKACFCKGDLCNGGPIPGIKETEEKSSGVECYSCSSKPPVYGSRKCDFQSPDDARKVWCADQAHCFKRTGTQSQPWSYYPVGYIERGCSNKMVPYATIEENEKLIKCLKKYGGCVKVRSKAGYKCFKGLFNTTAHPDPDAFDLTEIDELCVCEGDLCNGEAPKPTEVIQVIPEPTNNNLNNERALVEDKNVKDSSSFLRWIFLIDFIIIALVAFICLIMCRKEEEFVEINGEF